MMYRVMDEATEEVLFYTSSLQNAIDNIRKGVKGRLVIKDDNDTLLYDSKLGVIFKI